MSDMFYTHVYFAKEESLHTIDDGAHCFCEPEIIVPDGAEHARVIVHQLLFKNLAKAEVS